MINCKCNLIGKLVDKQGLKGKLNNPIVKEYPELEDLNIIPTAEKQSFKSNKYGYNEITVGAVEAEGITPELDFSETDTIELKLKDKFISKAIINKDKNLLPENVKEGTTINGIEGKLKGLSPDFEINDCSYLFYKNVRLNNLKYLINFCKNVTTTLYMFGNCSKLETLDLSSFDTSTVKTMEHMFYYCTVLSTLNLSNLDTSKVTDMSFMFSNCKALTTLDLSNLDTRTLNRTEYMFDRCYGLTTLNLSNVDMSKVVYMQDMFRSCKALTTLDLSNIKITNVYNMNYMFYDCDKLSNDSLNSILKMCTTAASLSASYRTLKYIGLTQDQAEICKTLSNYQAFLDAGWTTGY